jgi:hypothetical protein
MDSITEKLCRKCGEVKPITEFHKNKSKPRGNSQCKTCVSEQFKKKYRENPEIVIKRVAEWASKNPEKKRARGRRYYNAHKEEAREYRVKFRDRRKEYLKNYVRSEEGKAKDRAKARELTQKFKKTVIEHYGGKCACCGEPELAFMSIDHIDNNGSEMRRKKVHPPSGQNFYIWLIKNNFPSGFQVLCHNCNQAKSILGYCPHSKNSL